MGAVVGLADAAGFFYTARLFSINATSARRLVAGIAEGARLIFIIGLVMFVWHLRIVPILWLLCSAIAVSIIGKLLFIVKGLKA